MNEVITAAKKKDNKDENENILDSGKTAVVLRIIHIVSHPK